MAIGGEGWGEGDRAIRETGLNRELSYLLSAPNRWKTDVTEFRRWEEIPENAIKYLARVSELVGCPVEIVSVGPDRAQTVFRENSLAAVASA